VAWGYKVLATGMEGSADGLLCQAGRGRETEQPQHITSVWAGGLKAHGVIGALICLIAQMPAQLQALPEGKSCLHGMHHVNQAAACSLHPDGPEWVYEVCCR
jgi:hypothetical protein